MRRHAFLPILMIAGLPTMAAAQDSVTAPSGDAAIVQESVDADIRSAEAGSVGLPDLMESLDETASRIRMIFTLGDVEIVALGERRTEITPEIEEILRDHSESLADLRNAIQGNALIYHAVTTNGVGIPEIVAAEVSEDNSLTIYAFSTQG